MTSTRQPTTTTSAALTTEPTKTSQTTRSTTASSVTSTQPNSTVVTTSKVSFTSVTGEFTCFTTSKSEAVIAKTSRFDVGSFVGGIVLTLGVLVILYIGCKTYHSRRGIQYRTIDEHDAII
uniref:Transmembrane protein 123 n=1 Tax=Calidris pygmaea TaxID=425635 RepID=A0A8C3JYP7_9CHAR